MRIHISVLLLLGAALINQCTGAPAKANPPKVADVTMKKAPVTTTTVKPTTTTSTTTTITNTTTTTTPTTTTTTTTPTTTMTTTPATTTLATTSEPLTVNVETTTAAVSTSTEENITEEEKIIEGTAAADAPSVKKDGQEWNKAEAKSSGIDPWIVVLITICVIILLLIGLIFFFGLRFGRKYTAAKGSKDGNESGGSTESTTTANENGPKKRRGVKKRPGLMNGMQPVKPAPITNKDHHWNGPLKVTAGVGTGPMKHATDGDKSCSLKEVQFDAGLNEVNHIGTDVEMLEASNGLSTKQSSVANRTMKLKNKQKTEVHPSNELH